MLPYVAFSSRKKSIFNPEFVEVRWNEPWTPNPCHLHPKIANPGLNQTLKPFGAAQKQQSQPGLDFTLTESGTHMSYSSSSSIYSQSSIRVTHLRWCAARRQSTPAEKSRARAMPLCHARLWAWALVRLCMPVRPPPERSTGSASGGLRCCSAQHELEITSLNNLGGRRSFGSAWPCSGSPSHEWREVLCRAIV
jgi:hypothetical protein